MRIRVILKDCGTGAGGFKPGNTCGAGGGGSGTATARAPNARGGGSPESAPKPRARTSPLLSELRLARTILGNARDSGEPADINQAVEQLSGMLDKTNAKIEAFNGELKRVNTSDPEGMARFHKLTRMISHRWDHAEKIGRLLDSAHDLNTANATPAGETPEPDFYDEQTLIPYS